MNRKQFIATAGRLALATGAIGSASLLVPGVHAAVGDEKRSGSQPGDKASFVARRKIHEYAGFISAPPERVFPLLCPVREYEWLDGWKCRMIYSDSGVAEDNCMFETNNLEGRMTWVVSRYEPSRRIEFVTFVPDRMTQRLSIMLEAQGSSTRIHWTRKFTGLSDEGNQAIEYWQPEWDRAITEKLEYFLTKGTMLRNG